MAISKDMAISIIDLSTYDWLSFPYWSMALKIDDFPKFAKWLNEVDYELASFILLNDVEFEAAYALIKAEAEAKERERAETREREKRNGSAEGKRRSRSKSPSTKAAAAAPAEEERKRSSGGRGL